MDNSTNNKWLCDNVPYKVSLPSLKHVRNKRFVRFLLLKSLYVS